uniref:Transmembrane protein 17 n=1 Tax=Dicentrarchus labrax TaxID=13489 RepID=A0A8P4KCU4_DICLA
MDLPETLRKRLEDFSRNVLFDQSRTQPLTKENDPFSPHDKRVLSSLHLQMSLYFNMWFFPLWWISETTMLHLKYPALPDYYKFILVTVLIVMTLIEAIRLFLGYTGNLQEKVTHHSHKHKDITTYTNVRGRGPRVGWILAAEHPAAVSTHPVSAVQRSHSHTAPGEGGPHSSRHIHTHTGSLWFCGAPRHGQTHRKPISPPTV